MDEHGPEYRRWWAGVQLRVEEINQLHSHLKQRKSFTEEKRMLHVKKEKAEYMFTALGFAKVEDWSPQRLQDKLEGLADHVEEEGNDLPKLKGENKKLLDKVLSAIKDEEELSVTDGEGDEDDDDDDDDEVEEDNEDEADTEEDDDDDEPEAESNEDPDEEDDDEEDEDPTPSKKRAVKAEAKQPAAEEFVGVRELVAVLTRIANALEGKVPATASAERSAKPSSNGRAKLVDVIAAIRAAFAAASSEAKALNPQDVAKKLAPELGWEVPALKKRMVVQLRRHMPSDGIVVKKVSGGKFWVKKK